MVGEIEMTVSLSRTSQDQKTFGLNGYMKAGMRIFVLSLLFLLLSCQTPKKVIVYKTDIPEFSCPQIEKIMWSEYSINNTEEENLLVEPDNIEKVKKLIQQLIIIIQCYENNIENMRKKR